MPELTASDDIELVQVGDTLEPRFKTSTARLKEWTAGGDFEVTVPAYDADGVLETADVVWPDGSAGVFTRTAKNATWLAVDAYTITHVASGLTITQALVTRGPDGEVTNRPALAVA